MIEQWQFVRLEDLICSHACWRLAIVPLSLPFDDCQCVLSSCYQTINSKDVRKRKTSSLVYINFLPCPSQSKDY